MKHGTRLFAFAGAILLLPLIALTDESVESTRGRHGGRVRMGPRSVNTAAQHSFPARPAEIPAGVTIRVPSDYLTIQEAIDASNHGDTVLVSDGVYYENVRFRGKAIVVASEYLLDGDAAHIGAAVIDGSSFDPDSASVVYFISGEDTNSVLCGFTIRGGTGTNIKAYGTREGGGLLCYISGARICHNIIAGNVAEGESAYGGGLSLQGTERVSPTVILEGNSIVGNSARGALGFFTAGGGISAYFTFLRMDSNQVAHNTADGDMVYGGGIDVSGISLLQLNSNQIHQNTALGIEWALGGAVSFMAGTSGSKAELTGNTFLENRAENVASPNGGAGGAGSLWNTATIARGNVFVGNVAHTTNGYPVGGALYATTDLAESLRKNCGLTLSENYFANNVVSGGSDGRGGAIRMTYIPARVENNIIVRNTSENGRGGGIAFRDPPPSGMMQEVVNNTICHNSARYGGGVILRRNDTSVVLLNNILWENTASVAGNNLRIESDCRAYVYHCAIGGWSGGVGNISEDPQFSDSLYSLRDISPCIGAGADSAMVLGGVCRAPMCDCKGNTRPQPFGSRPDIGAWESLLGSPAVSVYEGGGSLPKVFALRQNYPNPFNPNTTIEFGLPQARYITLTVYNLVGEEVATLIAGDRAAGTYKVTWEASGSPSGVFFYRLTAGDHSQTKKAVLVK